MKQSVSFLGALWLHRSKFKSRILRRSKSLIGKTVVRESANKHFN